MCYRKNIMNYLLHMYY